MNEAEVRENRGVLRLGTAADEQLRWVACDLTGVVEHARLILDLSPLATVALGRALASSAMLLRLVTKRPRRLSLDFKGSGPMTRLLAECDAEGRLRGLVGDRHVLGERGPTDLRVGPALGLGLLVVRRTEAAGRDYESRVVLHDGEIGSDVAHYLDQSEQRSSAVVVGAHLHSEGVDGAGGLILEALPFADGRLIGEIERRLAALGSPSQLVGEEGLDALVSAVIGRFTPRTLEEYPLSYDCGCSRERLLGSLQGLPAEELQSLAAGDGTLDAECSYCGKTYRLGLAEILGERAN